MILFWFTFTKNFDFDLTVMNHNIYNINNLDSMNMDNILIILLQPA